MTIAPGQAEQSFEHLRVMLVVRAKLRGRADDERADSRIAQEVPGTLVDEHDRVSVSVSGAPFTLLFKLTIAAAIRPYVGSTGPGARLFDSPFSRAVAAGTMDGAVVHFALPSGTTQQMKFQAVIFDLGGVVFDSPLAEFRRYEKEHGLPDLFLGRVVLGSGPDGAWARLERGELALADFCSAFDEDARAAGAEISAARLMQRVSDSMQVRPAMLGAVRRLRSLGYLTAALTNNWKLDEAGDARMDELRREFDVFVESCRAGIRKPDPAIYELVCRELCVRPEQAVFLDDLGHNLKPARSLGMATIKVESPEAALGELAELLDVDLSAAK